jgi:hypothetical protein
MIPDIVIVSAYAVARLVGEYILTKESPAEAVSPSRSSRSRSSGTSSGT